MKKVKVFGIVIILIVAIIAVSMIIIKNSTKNKLENIYEQIIKHGQYKFERSTKNEENKIIVAEKDNKKIIDMYNLGNHTSTLIKQDESYLILHEKQEYYNYTNIIKDENPLVDELKEIVKSEAKKGKEEINGKKYSYEEYSGVSYFLLSSSKNIELDTVKTRFYFKGKKLEYIKTIYNTTDNEVEEELWKINVEFNVDNKIFEIPESYAESLV